ncbi:MAG: alpha-2-macroglobulin, partial [Bauldia sp.]
TTNAAGYAHFDPGLARGAGGAAPQLIDAETAVGDYAFLDLGRSSFDLTDRGVDGRPAPGPLDVFLSTERGIYRPGETVYLTALVRNARADAVGDLPLTLVVERPDGVEFLRRTLSDGGAGGYSAGVPLDEDAMRGSWHAKLFSDPKGAAIADVALLVEDFEPERLAFDITTAAKAIGPGAPVTIDLVARYLYGATAPGLSVDGDIEIKTVDALPGFPGYTFGLATDEQQSRRDPFETDATTDADGKTSFEVALPELPASTKPFEAKVVVRLTDTNGRAVERNLSLPVAAPGPRLGVKPLFDGDVAEGGPARFEVILVGPDGTKIARPGVKWTLERVETDWQWYRADGNWRYEPISQERRVDGGTLDTSADGIATVSGQVGWGHYRLTVSTDGGDATATSVEFNAGWYVASTGTDTPDVLSVGLDKAAYRIGDTAKLRLDPRFAGIALISVVDDRLITMKSVVVPAEGTTVDLEVTDQWGPGAYVTASLYRPMDIEAKRMPARALGLAWAKVAPGDRQLKVAVDAADEMRPRGPMPIPVSISNLQPGEQAYVTVAAVDLGILNLTNFNPPAPDDGYFGQRKLGMEIRDIYGLLIDRMQGIPGTVRSGGDGGSVRLQAPPPTQKLVAFYSGIQEVGADGKVSVSFDLPEFNGTVRVMVIAWTKSAVGHAVKDVIVRDPVVVSASIPRFMATGDTSRLLVEINNVAGPAGDYRLAINPDAGVTLAAEDMTRTITLGLAERTRLNVPISATAVGDHIVTVTLTTPDGQALPQELALGIRAPGLPVSRRNLVSLAAGGKLTVSADTLAEFVPGTTSVSLSVGGASRLDVAGILAALDRYPYGCAEQLTSRALPLVYLDDVAVSIGLASDAAVKERVQAAIAGVLAKQSASGAFGLWGPVDTGDLFLDAYVTDFLTRAADKGYDLPKVAKDLALDNLSNSLAYADDFESGGEAIAYALYVLARTGRAAIGDLRYYGESKLSAFSTPLAKAQVGAALALYGDQRRANIAFAAALADLNGETEAIASSRDDYGTVLRDQAAVLTLAAESKADTVDLKTLAAKLASSADARRRTSTQENAWMLLAANALIKDAQKTSFAVDGAQTDGPLYRRFFGEQLASAPIVIENRGADSLDAIVETRGVPLVPEPAGGEGFTIDRAYYTPSGEQRDIAAVAQNDRVIVVLKVTASESRSGHVLIVDPIPAGFEIENPSISASGDTASYGWLDVVLDAAHTEARTDRFVAALNRSDSDPQEYSVAYSMRAVSPGKFAQPAATVEDMYYPELQAHSGSGTVEVVGPTR